MRTTATASVLTAEMKVSRLRFLLVNNICFTFIDNNDNNNGRLACLTSNA